jgi:hypothetical protein
MTYDGSGNWLSARPLKAGVAPAPDRVVIVDEDMLTFRLYIDPDTSERCNYTVMVDYGELTKGGPETLVSYFKVEWGDQPAPMQSARFTNRITTGEWAGWNMYIGDTGEVDNWSIYYPAGDLHNQYYNFRLTGWGPGISYDFNYDVGNERREQDLTIAGRTYEGAAGANNMMLWLMGAGAWDPDSKTDAKSQVDLLWWHGHGGYDGSLADGYEAGIEDGQWGTRVSLFFDPAWIADEPDWNDRYWNKDLEWVGASSCNFLASSAVGTTGASGPAFVGAERWLEAMKGNPSLWTFAHFSGVVAKKEGRSDRHKRY